jgi:polyhydroxybutyrate depolymerase
MMLRPMLVGFACSSVVALAAGCSAESPADGPTIAVGGPGSSGASGVGGTPSAGTSGAATAGSTGMTSAGGNLGAGGVSGGAGPTGSAGIGGGGAGTAGSGTGGNGGPGPFTVPRGKSPGCGKQNAAFEPGKYTSKDIEVTGVDPYWGSTRKPAAGQGGYTFTHRHYYVRPPTGYDPNRAYPLVFEGGGCGNTDGTNGNDGNGLTDSAKADAISIGLSYVYPENAGACFGDEYENTYELNYWDSVYEEVTEGFCVDLEKVFIGGYSSGAWMSYTIAFARGGKVRGMGAGAGGIREKRPLPSNIPFAAMMITGADDGGNPVHKTKDGTTCSGSEADGCWKGKIICGFPGAETCYDTGSAHARDEILKRNGCVGTATEPYSKWPDCLKYTGCPAEFPVVYCMPQGGHTDGEDRHDPGLWDFWKALPAVP